MAEFHVEIALLSGRTAHISASPENSTVRQVMLDAGKALRIAIGTLTRQEARFSGTGNKNPLEIGQEIQNVGKLWREVVLILVVNHVFFMFFLIYIYINVIDGNSIYIYISYGNRM